MASRPRRSTWRGRGNRPRPSQSGRMSGPGGPRNMDLIASVSRSSGLEKDGDSLKDFKVQEEYKDFIEQKLDDYWTQFPRNKSTCRAQSEHQKEIQGNLTILFRKLREGIMSTKRNDVFALEVYETSLYLSILFEAPLQTTSTLSYLFQLYLRHLPDVPAGTSTLTAILALLHHLVSGYPSQVTFWQQLRNIPRTLLPQDSPAYGWISALSSAVYARNYAKAETLTHSDALTQFIPAIPADSSSSRTDPELAKAALFFSVNSLRSKTRASAWLVIRSAYRDLSCQPESSTPEWLARSLMLKPLMLQPEDGTRSPSLDWLEEKGKAGEVRRKEGLEGRWVLLRPSI